MLDVSESLLVGFDISNKDDEVILTVSKRDGYKLIHVNQFRGDEARRLYEELTAINLKKENE